MPNPPTSPVPSLASRPSVGTLIYFMFRARGEPPHLVAAYMGNRLENAGLPFSEYPWMKRTSPNGLCPWIVLPDGTQMAETLDVCLYLSKLSSPAGRPLAPTDDAQLKLFEVSNTPPLMHWPDNSNPDNCAWLLNMYPWMMAAPKVPPYIARVTPTLKQLEAQLDAANTRFFASEDAPGVGDLGMFVTIDTILSIAPNALLDAECPKLHAWHAAVGALAGIDEYLAHRPQIGSHTLGNRGSLMFSGRS